MEARFLKVEEGGYHETHRCRRVREADQGGGVGDMLGDRGQPNSRGEETEASNRHILTWRPVLHQSLAPLC